MSRLIGIEHGPSEFRVAVARVHLGRAQLLQATCVALDDVGQLAALTRGATAVRVGLPLQDVTHRILQVPFRRAAQIAATVPLEFLSQLPMEPDDGVLATHVLRQDRAGSTVLAAVARRATLETLCAPWRDRVSAPIEIDLCGAGLWALVPAPPVAGSIVVADGNRSYVSVRRANRLAGLRGLDVGVEEVDQFVAAVVDTVRALGTEHGPLWLADGVISSAAAADISERLRVALGGSVAPFAPDLVAAAGTPDHLARCVGAIGLVLAAQPTRIRFADPEGPATPHWPRRAVGLAVAAGLAGVLDLGLLERRLATEHAALSQTIRTEAASVVVEAGTAAAPLDHLERALAARRAGHAVAPGRALEALREASTRLPIDIPLQVDELRLDLDTLRLHGFTDSYEHVDAIRRALAASPLLADVQATDTRTAVDGRRVEFSLQALRRRPVSTTS